MVRLDKFLCDCGAGTRSQVKQILKAGRVAMGGSAVTDGSVKFDPGVQIVTLDGQPLLQVGRVVLMLNKPAGYITATEDPRQKTVMELIPAEYKHLELKPVGRLDKDTEGLLLFTNDGDLLHRLISPKNEIDKIYYARHEGTAGQKDVEAFACGLVLRDGTQCLPAKLQPLAPGESLITVQEGKYHQVRRMMASRGMHVEYLQRRQEAELTLGQLALGEVRELSGQELQTLLETVNMQ